MKNFGILYLLIVGFVFLWLHLLSGMEYEEKMKQPFLNELALEPDHMMFNVIHYLDEHLPLTATGYMEEVVSAMQVMERTADTASVQAIYTAIRNIRILEAEMSADQLDRERIHHSFLTALNVLALAQLRCAGFYGAKGEIGNVRSAMHYAVDHLNNAIRFSTGRQREVQSQLLEKVRGMVVADQYPDEHWLTAADQLLTKVGIITEIEAEISL